ncbi:MAG: 3-dehydroquinate synthase, partial [Pseudomonadota bacterium]
NVAPHYVDQLADGLRAGGVEIRGSVIVPPGERAKCWAEVERVCDELLALGLERADVLIALGGGVVGDLAGFAAAVIRRGIAFVQVPTTLLAQVDSSVGGKTGINTPRGKNLIGAFHQPALVLADVSSLATLPKREVRAGYAEVVKYGLLGDAAFYRWLDDNREGVLSRDPASIVHAVTRSVDMKSDIVARDERETGDRALLNLGHTFGHALEAWAGYSDRLLHGEAVAIGMCQAFRFSEQLGLVAPQTAAQVASHIKSVGLPTRIDDIQGDATPTIDEIIALMRQDKKVVDGELTLVLARAIGSAFVTRAYGVDAVASFLADEVATDP